jgi:hypothetical protein
VGKAYPRAEVALQISGLLVSPYRGAGCGCQRVERDLGSRSVVASRARTVCRTSVQSNVTETMTHMACAHDSVSSEASPISPFCVALWILGQLFPLATIAETWPSLRGAVAIVLYG